MPTREIYWNISWGIAVYPIALVAFGIMVLGFYSRVIRWRAGRPIEKPTNTASRLYSVLAFAIGQLRILRDPYAGVMHLLIFWGFFALFIGTLLVMVHEDFRLRILQGDFYLYYKLVLNISGLGAIVGILMAAYRRYVARSRRLSEDRAFGIAIALIVVVLVSGFGVQGLRIGATELTQHPDWARWAPIGLIVALGAQGLGEASLRSLHAITWWFHMFAAFGFIAYCIGWSTQSHILVAPLNVYLRRPGPNGALKAITDFKDKRSLGAGTIGDMSWKDLVEADACVRCGRCHETCPATLTGKPLSPRKIVQNMRNQMEQECATLQWRSSGNEEPSKHHQALISQTISEDEIWSCTTCGSCQYQCPIFVEPMTKIIELRRHQVMVRGKLPETAQVAMMSLQKRGHPWTGTPHMRTDWAEGLALRQMSETGGGDLLFWVGCSGALVDRNMSVSAAVARILQSADVEFSVLGDEEVCCGDPARRIGNEFLYQTMVKKNIKILQQYGVKTILTTCPHCFNTFKNEYADFGGTFEVVHHTQLIADLLAKGRLKLEPALAQQLTFHDPCYLGRYNGILDAPRALARAVGADGLREMTRSRERSLCCGGGGGRSFMEETIGSRINQERTREALSTGAGIIATACPFCLQMFEDGIKGVDASDSAKAMDLAELVCQALPGVAAPADTMY